MPFTDNQLNALRHMLGITDPSKKIPEPYRNYCAAPKGDTLMQSLEALGAVRCYRRDSQYDWYTATASGRAAAMASYKALRWPKPRRVYHAFLSLRDVFPDLTFKQFLSDPRYAETRQTA